MIILLAFTTLVIGVLSYFLSTWTYWKRRGIPGPLGYPILGSALEMLDYNYPPYLQLKEWTKQYGKVFGITEGVSKTLVISDPDLVQEVFVKQYDNFFGRKKNAIQGDPDKEKIMHVFAAQGHRWKRLRTITSPSFSNNSLRELHPIIEDSASQLLRHIETKTEGGKPIDLLIFFQEFTFDIIDRIAMGQTDAKQLLMFQNPRIQYVRQFFAEPRKGLFLSGALAPFTASIIRKLVYHLPQVFDNPTVHLIRIIKKAVEARMAQRAADEEAGIEPGEPQDFIDLFLDAKSDDVGAEDNEDFTKGGVKVNKQLTTDEIVAQCFVFLLAGFDTTALSMSYTSFLLATHPEIQRKLQQEVDRECDGDFVSFDQLSKLKYLECVVKETLRLYPLGTMANSRCCMRSTRIGDYEIEEGVNVMCDTWTLHSDRKIWGDDAEEFKPERWEQGEEHLIQKGGYIPFGLGPRQCIGMRLAYMEEKILLSGILRRYTLETCEKTQIPLKLVGSRTTQPKSVWLNMKPREDLI